MRQILSQTCHNIQKSYSDKCCGRPASDFLFIIPDNGLNYTHFNPMNPEVPATIGLRTDRLMYDTGFPGFYNRLLGMNSEGIWFTETIESTKTWTYTPSTMASYGFAPLETVTHIAVVNPYVPIKKTMWVPVELKSGEFPSSIESVNTKFFTDLGYDGSWTAKNWSFGYTWGPNLTVGWSDHLTYV